MSMRRSSRGPMGLAVIVILVALQAAQGAAAAPRAAKPLMRPPSAAASNQMTLEQAPPALRAAVLRALGVSASPSSQQAELLASDRAAADAFGTSVAINGNGAWAVVGAPGKNSNTGAAYIWHRVGAAWNQTQELTIPTGMPGDAFGTSVAMRGAYAIVGEPGRDSPPRQNDGGAYIYHHAGGAWNLQAGLTESDPVSDDAFGTSVAISGSWAVVGAPGKNSNTGAAYTWQRVNAVWNETQELTIATGMPDDAFGTSVAISGNYALVGEPGRDSPPRQNDGGAYVFKQALGTWNLQAGLTESDPVSDDAFGTSVAISGQYAVVGAPGKNSNTGAAYIWHRVGAAWNETQELTIPTGMPDDAFGASVAMSGDYALVGEPGRDSPPRQNDGGAYVYQQASGTWNLLAGFTESDPVSDDAFGTSVAISSAGQYALVGAPGKDTAAGAAYVFFAPF
jgi:FG-GAP repeat